MHKALLASTALAMIPAGAIFMMASPAERVAALEAKREEFVNASQSIIDALGEDEELTDEQIAEIEANKAEVEKLDKQIAALKTFAPQGQGRKSSADGNGNGNGSGNGRIPAQPRINDQRHGFSSLGAFAVAVRQHYTGQAETDDLRKLRNAATTYGNEGTGADGGFPIPPEFSREIMVKVMAEENLLNRAAQLTTSRNSMSIPKDETTPWQSSGGVQAYWEGEAAPITASKPAFEQSQVRLVKLTALVPITEEALEDAVGLESWLRAKAPAKMAAKINTAFVRGTGVGQPLGILRSPSLITVNKETSQPGDTVWFANINNMWSRMYAPWRRNAIWLINQDVEPQLEAMAFDPQASSKIPVYLPPGGLSQSPYATLKGRPVVPIEACSTVGDEGDIILVDMAQYWAFSKSGGVRTDTSIHLYFDQAVTAFRFIFRLNGMPAWSSVIQPENGSLTRSWAVTLAART